MTELQKDTLVQLVETGMKVSDKFFTNYTKLDVKSLRKKLTTAKMLSQFFMLAITQVTAST